MLGTLMTAAIQHRTRAPEYRGQSRFFASRVWRRAPRCRHSRPEKRVGGQKTASGIFFTEAPKTRRENSTQTLGLHQENYVWAYDFALGCAVGPNNTADRATAYSWAGAELLLVKGIYAIPNAIGWAYGAGTAPGFDALVDGIFRSEGIDRSSDGGWALDFGTDMAVLFAGSKLGSRSAAETTAGEVSAATPVGRLGSPLGTIERNTPTSIAGRDYTGHALDQMQTRGLTPTVVENTVQNGARSAGNTAAEIVHYDPVNNVTVVTDASSGRVVTVYGGKK